MHFRTSARLSGAGHSPSGCAMSAMQTSAPGIPPRVHSSQRPEPLADSECAATTPRWRFRDRRTTSRPRCGLLVPRSTPEKHPFHGFSRQQRGRPSGQWCFPHVLTARQFLRVRAFSQQLPNMFGTGVPFKDTSVNAQKSDSAWGDVQKCDVLPGDILAEDLRKCEGIFTVASKPLLCKFDSPTYCGDSPVLHLLQTVERTSQVDAQLILLQHCFLTSVSSRSSWKLVLDSRTLTACSQCRKAISRSPRWNCSACAS